MYKAFPLRNPMTKVVLKSILFYLILRYVFLFTCWDEGHFRGGWPTARPPEGASVGPFDGGELVRLTHHGTKGQVASVGWHRFRVGKLLLVTAALIVQLLLRRGTAVLSQFWQSWWLKSVGWQTGPSAVEIWIITRCTHYDIKGSTALFQYSRCKGISALFV